MNPKMLRPKWEFCKIDPSKKWGGVVQKAMALSSRSVFRCSLKNRSQFGAMVPESAWKTEDLSLTLARVLRRRKINFLFSGKVL
jgi:hypothetical protein